MTLSSAARMFRPLAASSRLGGVRAYRPTSSRLALKESDRHTDGIKEEIDHHKNDQLRKQKDGKGHWKDELASESESAVKADRHEHPGGASKDIEELQQRTKESSEREKKN